MYTRMLRYGKDAWHCQTTAWLEASIGGLYGLRDVLTTHTLTQPCGRFVQYLVSRSYSILVPFAILRRTEGCPDRSAIATTSHYGVIEPCNY